MDNKVQEPNAVLVGDELGQIKKIDLTKKETVTFNLTPEEPIHPSKRVVSISPLTRGSSNEYFLVGRKSGDLFIYDATTDDIKKVEYSIDHRSVLVNCQCIDDQNIVLGFKNGSTYRINIEKALCLAKYKPNSKALNVLGIDSLNPDGESSKKNKRQKTKSKPSQNANETSEAKPDIMSIFNPNWNTDMTYLSCFKVRNGKIAIGGYNSDLKVFDIATGKNVFTAKPSNTDWLGIKHPIWISGLDWLDADDNPHLIATCSRTEPFVKIYDIKEKQKKPIFTVNLKSTNNANNESNPPSLTTICSMPCINHFQNHSYAAIIGTTLGRMIALDLRIKTRSSKVIGGFKGFNGSIRDIQYARSNKSSYKIYSCSIDRFISVHHLQSTSRHLEQRIYVKTRPTCLAPFVATIEEPPKVDNAESNSEEDDENDDYSEYY